MIRGEESHGGTVELFPSFLHPILTAHTVQAITDKKVVCCDNMLPFFHHVKTVLSFFLITES